MIRFSDAGFNLLLNPRVTSIAAVTSPAVLLILPIATVFLPVTDILRLYTLVLTLEEPGRRTLGSQVTGLVGQETAVATGVGGPVGIGGFIPWTPTSTGFIFAHIVREPCNNL